MYAQSLFTLSAVAYTILLIGAVFEGLMRSLFSGNNEAMLHDTLTEAGQKDSYQEYLGKVSSRYQAALAVSAVLGSFIAYLSFEANGTYNLVVWLSVIPQLLCLFVSFQFIDPKIHSENTGNIYAHLREAYFNIVKNAKLRTLSTGWILSFAIGEASFQFRVAFINALWPLWAIGIARTISNIAASVSFYMAGRLIKRFGEFRLMIGGMTFSETTNLMSLLFPGVLSPMFMGMTSIFYGVNMVSIGGLMQREFTPQQRATMGSLNAFAGSIVFAIISFSLGLLADHVGVIRALTIATLFSYLPIVFYWKSFHTKPNTTGHTSPQTPSPAQR